MRYAEALDQQATLHAVMASVTGRALCEGMMRLLDERGSGRKLQDAFTMLLQASIPYYWSDETCNLVEAAAATMPDYRLAEEHFPSQGGFCWFARPFVSRGCPLHALLWWRYTDERLGPRAMFWEIGRAPEWPDAIHPIGSFSWDVGEALSHRAGLLAGRPPIGESPMSDDEHAAWVARSLRRVAALLLFLDQRVLVTHPEAAPRATRRRAERAGWEEVPAVEVVYLRRPASATSDGEHGDVEWSCRWLVRGHWRQQWCAAAREHRPIWITPYVKGPEDKPLKPPRATVFAVVR